MKAKFFYDLNRSAVLCGLALCLLLSCGMAGCRKNSEENGSEQTTSGTSVPSETAAELSITDLLKSVLTLKGNLEAALDDLKENNIGASRQKIENTFRKTETIRKSLEASSEALGDSLPSLQKQLSNIRKLLDMVDFASEKLLLPALEHIEKDPLSELKAEEGIRVQPLMGYLELAERLMPDVEVLADMAGQADLSLLDSKGRIEKYLDALNELVELYQKDRAVFARLKAMLGGSGDRLYLIAAQNSAEIRSSGGFPGAVGTVRIRDGVFILEDFKRVYDVLASYTPAEAQITAEEDHLFLGGLSAPRDADYCPDFERVASIWALGYEARQGEKVDGVISATPVIVQRLLAALDEEIKLFDGTVVNGENAVKVLQHDLYFQYFGRDYVPGRETISDQLFADAAKKAADQIVDAFGFSNLVECLSAVKACIHDRSLMFWMRDSSEQTVIQALGANGGLNDDPEDPQAGIYYSCTVPSKMGWFLILDAQIGERVKNEDGSYSYPISVTFSNDMTPEELNAASNYITGGAGGAIGGCAYFFAPAGGTVGNFVTTNDVSIERSTYRDLQLGYMRSFHLYADKPVTVTYTVTTAPGVEAPLSLSMTPTVQDYH